MSSDYTHVPLPEQYEQQYDVATNRFYFIDHAKKVTTWIDPRIEIFKKLQQENASKNNTVGTTNKKPNASTTAPTVSIQDKKAKDIQEKYPKIALTRIKQLLEENFDNVSSVESVLSREVQIAQNQEILRKQEESQKKAETEKKLKDEQEAKLKKEKDKKNKTVKGNSKIIIGKKEEGVPNANSMEDIKKTGTIDSVQKEDKMELSKEKSSEESKSRLDKGPNKSICSGPNPKNKMGPNLDFVKEKESLAKGADPSNCVGSRGSYRITAN